MSSIQRREFLRNVFSGIAGSTLLVSAAKNQLLAKSPPPPAGDVLSFDESYWRLVKHSFSLEPGLHYFNNASLGPSPELVIDTTVRFMRALDSFPSKYMWGGWQEEKEDVRKKAGSLFDVSPEEIAIIHNTTEGMNLVAHSLPLEAGDEVIVADHEHPSGTNPWLYWQKPKGVKIVRPTLPILPKTRGEIIDVYRSAITQRTRVISICHMINTNGMILPVREISEIAREKGILVAVDGAQSAGMLHFDLADLGCDYYAASSHKWLFSPKGVGLFYAREESQTHLRPLIVAAGFEDASVRRLENYNTRNLPEVLGLGTALDFHSLLGAERKENRIYDLKHYFRAKIDELPGFTFKTPSPDELSAGIQTLEIQGRKVVEVQQELARRYAIDCRPMSSHGLNGLRISLSVFNTRDDIDYLVDCLVKIRDM